MTDFTDAYHDQVSEYGTASTPSSSIPDSPLPATPDSTRTKHDRKRSESHIPRPPNAFLLFRSDFLKKRVIPTSIEAKQYNISRIAGDCWKRMTIAEQQVWNDLAKEKEKEHARMYPDYQYKPVKRSPVQKRRKTATTEEEIKHCALLRAKFIPEKTGPILHAKKSVRRIRKSRAKSRVNKNVVRPTPTVSQSPPADNNMVFMEPLRPPFDQSTADESFPITNVMVLDPALEPPVIHDVPPASGICFEGEDEWLSESMTPIPASPEEDLLNAVAHIQAQFDMVRQSEVFPMAGSFYPQDAQTLYKLEPFFIPTGTTDHVLNSPSHPAPMIVGQYSPFTTGHQLFPPTPPGYCANAAFIFPDLGSEDFWIPQSFSIRPPATEPTPLETPPQLVPSAFEAAPNSLDTVMFSFDESSLSKLLLDVNGQYNLFGENSEGFVFDSEASFMGDVLHTDICSTSVKA